MLPQIAIATQSSGFKILITKQILNKMKKKYERPDLEEMELVLEGSFLAHRTTEDGVQEGVNIETGEGDQDAFSDN